MYRNMRRVTNSEDLYGVAIAAANGWGLLLVVVLLGYALPEIPKMIWRSADYEKTLKFYKFEAVNYKAELDTAKKELEVVLKVFLHFFQ